MSGVRLRCDFPRCNALYPNAPVRSDYMVMTHRAALRPDAAVAGWCIVPSGDFCPQHADMAGLELQEVPATDIRKGDRLLVEVADIDTPHLATQGHLLVVDVAVDGDEVVVTADHEFLQPWRFKSGNTYRVLRAPVLA